MDSFASWSSRPVSDLQAQIYNHLADCRRQEQTDQVLQRFQSLFIEGDRYADDAVWDALVELLYLPEAEREFKYTLNRCSRTLVNPWYTQPKDHWAIPALVGLFEVIPPTGTHNSDVTRRIRYLSQRFTTTEQFAALRRFAELVQPSAEDAANQDFSEQPVAQQLRRYPFLYDSDLLVTKDSDQPQRDQAQELRQQQETKLGIDLARWARQQAGRPFANPTQLEDDELQAALRYYTGKVSGNRSHRDMAHLFASYSRTVRSFRDFKEEFLEYLLAPLTSVDRRYEQHPFARNLRTFVRQVLREFDDEMPKDYTIQRFCQIVLNFLVVEGRSNPVFRRFRVLLEEAGHILTLGLLLRVVLFCAAVKPWLENRLAVLFKHHEQARCGEAAWLIKALEHANVALITNFNKAYSF